MMMERKVKLCVVNPNITCILCKGYLIDATTITECLHTFCRSCIVKYLEENNTCPTCGIVIHQSHPMNYISHDRTMQDIVYKLVPNLQEKELKRQKDFYKKNGIAFPNGDGGFSDQTDVIASDSDDDYYVLLATIHDALHRLGTHNDDVDFLDYVNSDNDIVTPAIPPIEDIVHEISDHQEATDVSATGNDEVDDDSVPAVVPRAMNEEDKKNIEKSSSDKEEDKDHHKSDEQVNICLECDGNQLKLLKRKYLRLSAQATISHLKKFVALKIFNNLDRYKDVDILCNEELLGKDHMLKFILATRWRVKDGPLLLHYRQRLEI